MEIRIGIANTGRELNFETSEAAADVKKSVADGARRRRDARDASPTPRATPTSSRPRASPTSSSAPKSRAASASSPDHPTVQILLALIVGAAIGVGRALPRRRAARRAASPSVRSSVPSPAGLVWTILTWAGVGMDNPWLWLSALVAPIVVTYPVLLILGRARAPRTTLRERARLKLG